MDVLAEVTRSGLVESRHRGVAALVGPDGEVTWSIGDPSTVIFPRSANKPFQAVGMLRCGLDLDGSALALAAHHPVEVRRSTAADLLDDLALRDGATTVVWHSVVRHYLDPGEQDRVSRRLDALGATATPASPLVHLAMEPQRRGAGTPDGIPVTLRTWTGGPDDGRPRVLGHAAPHGLPTTWDDPSGAPDGAPGP